jgi:hypothetical protein
VRTRLFHFAAALLLAGCATTRVVPVPAAGVAVDARDGSAGMEADGVRVVVRPSAWQGSPPNLPSYVTPFHLLIVNGSALPLRYDYGDLRLFDEGRFQYTALPPAEVARMLRWGRAPGPVLVAAAERCLAAARTHMGIPGAASSIQEKESPERASDLSE